MPLEVCFYHWDQSHAWQQAIKKYVQHKCNTFKEDRFTPKFIKLGLMLKLYLSVTQF